MKKIIIVLLFFTGTSISQVKQEFKFIPNLIIGEDAIGPAEYLFEYPGFIDTDNNQNIYIAEKKALTVRVFDKNGNFIKNIGRRGRGPGEFLDITLMKINKSNELMVFDNFMYRISYFNLDGRYIKEIKYSPSLINWPRNMIQLNDGSYLMAYYLENENNLFFLWDQNFTKRYGVISEKDMDEDPNNELKKVKFYGFHANNIAIRNNIFACSKYLYDGIIYLFNYKNGKIEKLKTISGFIYKNKPYSSISDNVSSNDSDIEIYYLSNRFKANIHNISLGLFYLKDASLIHFTKLENKNEIIFGYEKYDKQYNLLGYYIISKTKITNKNRRMLLFGIQIAHMDKHGNIYLIDNTEYPKIERIRLD